MKKLSVLGTLIVLVLLGFVFKDALYKASYPYLYYSPCDTPIRYSIGEIDPQFHLTAQDVQKRAQTAENIWERAYGKNLFEYDSSSTFPIQVIYDERQKLRSEASTLRSELENEQPGIDSRLAAFKTDVAAFQENLDQLNKDIAYWNSQGGAPEDEYNNLIKRQNDLKEESARLQQESKELNISTDNFNHLAKSLNQTVETFNEALEQKPEGGLYSQNGSTKSITIYFNTSEDEFVYTLAHEMGHALGMEHVTDKNSIMYPQVNLVLTPSKVDVEQLEKVCKKVSVFQPFITKLQNLRFRF